MAESLLRVVGEGETFRDQYEAAYDIAELYFGHRVFSLESSSAVSGAKRGTFAFVSHRHERLIFVKECCRTASEGPHHHHCEKRPGAVQ